MSKTTKEVRQIPAIDATGQLLHDAAAELIRKPPDDLANIASYSPEARATYHGFGIMKGPDGTWLSVRANLDGDVEVLNPKRHGKWQGESKALAVQRVMAAFREDVLTRPG